MGDQEVLKVIAISACPVLLGVIGWFIRGMVKSSLDATEGLKATVHQFDISIAIIKRDYETITRDMNQIVVELKNLKGMQEDVIILKRDQATIWRKIDELSQCFKSK